MGCECARTISRCEVLGKESVNAEMSSVAVTELTKWLNRCKQNCYNNHFYQTKDIPRVRSLGLHFGQSKIDLVAKYASNASG